MVNFPDVVNLFLYREVFTAKSTIGKLYLNGKAFCYTLEDVVRADGIKIQDETAIPEGVYKVILSMSNRFKRIMPLLLNVPNFNGVRMHGGNKSENTSGCPLLAFKKLDNYTIYNSAESLLTECLQRQDKKLDILLTIQNKKL